MTRARFAIPLLVACSVFAAPHAAAQDSSSQRRPLDGEVIGSEAFLGAHPDLKYRLLGLQHYGKGDWARALEDFRRAARYGDKPAQGMIGEMHWNGEGVAVDRALAYAWMDIAAERGYPLLLAKRERYWGQLDETERARAVEVGTGMYTEFGDPAAKPRLERLLRQARRNTTGSRVGSVGSLVIYIPTPAGMRQVDGSTFYQDKYWKPEQYWTWQDHDWKAPPRGEVSVGEILTDTRTVLPDDDAPAGDPPR